MFKRTLITCALPYANGPLHIGQIAGAHLPGDIYYRFQKLRGEEVIHICGTDDHGVANTIAAEKKGISPAESTGFYYQDFLRTLTKLGIIYDNFSQTQRPLHHRTAQEFFLRIYERGYFYRKEIEQLYCEKCKRFLPERYVHGTCPHCGFEDARGDQCEKCGRWLEPTDLVKPVCSVCGATPVIRPTWHYYFKLTELSEPLRKWLESRTDWKPNVRNTALGWIKEGLQDRPITRDLSWGVPVPLPDAAGKVLYVWFDAPVGYITSTKEWCESHGQGPDGWKLWWQNPESRILHFLGKDNIVFHALIWPGMLMAHGDFALPDNVPANEFLNLMGRKLSTSRNWAVWAEDFADEFGTDYARYGIAISMPETRDSDFDFNEFRGRVNGELVNTYGNFVHRTLSFISRFTGATIPDAELDPEVAEKIKAQHAAVTGFLSSFQFRKALAEVHNLAFFANQYFDRRAPWKARKDDPGGAAITLYSCCQLIRTLSVLFEPFVPVSSERIRQMIGLGPVAWDDSAAEDASLRGRKLGEITPPFARIEDEKIEAQIAKLGLAKPAEKENMPEITIEDFRRMDIRVAEITEARRMEGADRLLVLAVRMGGETRQLVAGIATNHDPGELVGKKIVVLANLEPATIRGHESQGMLLAATDPDGKPVILVPEWDVPPGSRIS